MRKLSLVAAALTLTFGAQAQTLKTTQVNPAQPVAGVAAKVQADFDISGGLNCAVRVDFGDGTSQVFKVNQEKDALMTLEHSWAKAGSYTVKVEPKNALPVLKCNGKAQTVAVTVKPAAAVAATAPGCPTGWTLNAKSVNKKTGAYTCTAKAGTDAAAPVCTGKLKAFADSKKGQLGCRA